MIQIWGKPQCPSCIKAKTMLENREIKFEYFELDKDFTREQVLAEFPEARTFTQIIINGIKVGGYEQMVQYMEDHNYNGTGYSL